MGKWVEMSAATKPRKTNQHMNVSQIQDDKSKPNQVQENRRADTSTSRMSTSSVMLRRKNNLVRSDKKWDKTLKITCKKTS